MAGLLPGAGWSGLSLFGRQALQFAATAFLARLLSPSDFGVFCMAMVAANFLELFKDLGTSAAVVQRSALDDGLLSSLFWTNTAVGLFIAALLWSAAPWIASLYGHDQVAVLLRLLCLGILFSGPGHVHRALLTRRLEFQRLAGIELLSSAAGAGAVLAAAAAGLGSASLALQGVISSLVLTLLSWIACGWRPSPRWQFAEVRSVSDFSLGLCGFNLANFLARNTDYLLIAKFLGEWELGLYTLAYRLMLYPIQAASGVLGRVLFPLYSRLQLDDAGLRDAHLNALSVVAKMSFPVIIGMAVLSRPLVLAILGPRWEDAAPMISLLSVAGLLQCVMTMNGSIYAAKGRTRLQFGVGALWSLITLAAFAVGIRWGALGVAGSYAVVNLALFYPALAIPYRLIGLKVSRLRVVLLRPLVSSLVAAAFIIGLEQTVFTTLPPFWSLAVLIPAGLAAYLACFSRTPAWV